MSDVRSPWVYIILVNWNSWKDTIECLESVYRSEYPDYKVVVCDNNSQDGSMDFIKSWASGELDIWIPSNNSLRDLTFPPVAKPIRYIEYNYVSGEVFSKSDDDLSELILIQSGSNLGFAGGNNVGTKYALSQGEFNCIWFLNNDTVIKPDALSQLIKRIEDEPTAGICGSRIYDYNNPSKIQALGGAKYNKYSSTCSHIKPLAEANHPLDISALESQMDYIVGASMLVTNTLVKDVGLMCEDYFLFFEEFDLAIRARKMKFSLGFANNSVIYHKGGVSTGSSYHAASFSYSADYWINRSRLLFVKKHYPYLIPFLYLRFLAAIFNRINRKQFDRIPMILSLMINNFPILVSQNLTPKNNTSPRYKVNNSKA